MKTILFCLISSVLFGCSVIPPHNVAAKIAVDRATLETLDEYGSGAMDNAISGGYNHLDLTPAGNYLLYAIEKHNKVLQKLSGNVRNGMGLPRFTPSDVVREDFIMEWVEAKL